MLHVVYTCEAFDYLIVCLIGTGKTLTARALANSLSCGNSNSAEKDQNGSWSANGRKVAFFMRKGADCLSKWVGEGERQLRLLFEQVHQHEALF